MKNAVDTVKIDDLKEAEYNPRKMSKVQEKGISDSLRRFGFVTPVVVNKHPERENVIIGGHQRIKIWKKLGNTDVPVTYVNLSVAEERELNIRLNQNSAEFDEEKLIANFLKTDLEEWGFEKEDLNFFEGEKEGSKSSLSLTEEFLIEIECEDENDLKGKYEQLTELGLKCRILTL